MVRKPYNRGDITVEAFSHRNFLFAYKVIEILYGGGDDVLIELSLVDEGVVIYDGAVPVGVCLIQHHPNLPHPFVMDCCVLDAYKGTKWAVRLLREMKRMLGSAKGYYILYDNQDNGAYCYKGEKDSIEAIVASKAIGKMGNLTLIRN